MQNQEGLAGGKIFLCLYANNNTARSPSEAVKNNTNPACQFVIGFCLLRFILLSSRSMGRPTRIEFVGALYHVTSRGNRQEDIYTKGKTL